MTERNKYLDSDYSFEPVPERARRGFWPMFFILLGFTFCSSSMSVGAKLGSGMDLLDFILCVSLGGAVLALYAGLLAYIGCDTGLSFDLLARHSFGRRGSKLPSIMIALTQIGWFGVGVAMFAVPAAEALQIHTAVLIIAAGVCMTASAYFGIRGLQIVSYISVTLILVFGLYSMISVTRAGGGLMAIFEKETQGMTMIIGINLVIGSFISGGTTTPNFTRFAARSKAAVISAVIAFFLGNTLMFVFGAVGGAFTGKDDIFYVMMAQGLLMPALVVLGANIWTTNDNALYSAGLGLSNLTGIRKRPMVLAAGVTGTALAIWIYQHFVDWLTFLNATLPPVGAIIIMDYFFNPAAYRENGETGRDIHWEAVSGVVIGALVGNFIPWGVAGINAVIAAGLCYGMFRVKFRNSPGRGKKNAR